MPFRSILFEREDDFAGLKVLLSPNSSPDLNLVRSLSMEVWS